MTALPRTSRERNGIVTCASRVRRVCVALPHWAKCASQQAIEIPWRLLWQRAKCECGDNVWETERG